MHDTSLYKVLETLKSKKFEKNWAICTLDLIGCKREGPIRLAVKYEKVKVVCIFASS